MTLPPAGWYTSPHDSTQPMWWDGERWCPDGIPTPEVTAHAEKPLSSKNRTSSIALALAGSTAALAFLPFDYLVRATIGICLSVIALTLAIFGLSGAVRIKRNKGKSNGFARSITALLLSAGMIIVFCIGTVETIGTLATADQRSVAAEVEGNPTPEHVATPEKSPSELTDEFWESEGFSVVDSGNNYYRWLTEEEKADSSCGYYACSFALIHSERGCSAGFYIKADILSNNAPIDWTNATTASVEPGETVSVLLESIRDDGDQFRISEITCLSR